MGKRRKSGLETKKLIIDILKNGEVSLRKLETKLNTNYKTINMHCKELEFLGIIKLIRYKKNDKNGRPYTIARLTDYGMELKV